MIGVVLTSIQQQKAVDDRSVKMYAMDVGSPAAATALYEFKRDENPDTSTRVACRYGPGDAVIVDYAFYYFAVARFGQYFFQLELSGVTDRAVAVAATETWFGYWEGKAAQ